MTVAVGLTLQPEPAYLELLAPRFAEVDYLEVTPETAWRRDVSTGAIEPNGFWREYLRIGAAHDKPFVAHAVHGSFGTAAASDRPRQREWQEMVAAMQAAFGFRWLTDHLGASVLGDRGVALPVALPMTEVAARLVRERLLSLQQVVPDVGVENSVFYFLLGDWLDEPRFLAEILSSPHTHLLLDLHNAWTMAQNSGADVDDYLARLDLSRVIEIHLSGGRDSPDGWLPDGRTLRLDSHDDAVPEPVWQLFERVLPRCGNLRGVTLERMEGTIDEGAVSTVRDELRRMREVMAHV
ncbi:MAG: DUF692 family protein [Planctomycetes bacterium]|nr:DUF692 family protein [Planctomycetota bacterium]